MNRKEQTLQNYVNNLDAERLYGIWLSMLYRCNLNSTKLYCKDYGARGIGVCSEWAISFDNFYNWSIKNRL